MDIYGARVLDTLKSDEYREVYALYQKKFGHFHYSFLPEWETLKGFREKVEESVKTGYSVLPEAYSVEQAEMWAQTKRYEEIEKKYRSLTGNGIPLMQIGGIGVDDLEKLVGDCARQGKDLFPEYFDWDGYPGVIY